MIDAGTLYDWREEISSAHVDRLREMANDLIDNVHRLQALIQEMADFRSSQEHEKTMQALKDIRSLLNKDA